MAFGNPSITGTAPLLTGYGTTHDESSLQGLFNQIDEFSNAPSLSEAVEIEEQLFTANNSQNQNESTSTLVTYYQNLSSSRQAHCQSTLTRAREAMDTLTRKTETKLKMFVALLALSALALPGSLAMIFLCNDLGDDQPATLHCSESINPLLVLLLFGGLFGAGFSIVGVNTQKNKRREARTIATSLERVNSQLQQLSEANEEKTTARPGDSRVLQQSLKAIKAEASSSSSSEEHKGEPASPGHK